MKLALWRVAEFAQGTGDFRNDSEALGYSIDSRTIKPGEVFFAVKGERLDGHDYVATAMERGAVAAVVGRDHLSRFPDPRNLIVVADPQTTKQHQTTKKQCLWRHPVVGVTGSAGKTTR